MKSGIIFCIILVLTIGTVLAGWERTYGGPSWDYGYSVKQTSDGGYIVAGSTNSFGAGEYDVYLVKTDGDGDTLWTRTYGGSGNDYGASVSQTSDGGYIVAGIYNEHPGPSDFYLVKTDAAGDTIWTRTYGGSSHDYGYSVAQTTDGGYIVAGVTYSFGAGLSDVYLIKTDAEGDTIWTRAYGGSYDDCGHSVAQTTDCGYIVAGGTESFGADDYDIYLVKTDSDGDTLWTRTYGGSSSDWANSVAQTSDGGYIIAGETNSFGAGDWDVYLVKTDGLGDTIWTRAYGGSYDDNGYSVAQTTDGGYIVVGTTWSFGAGMYDVYLVKTDAEGDTLWTRTYGGSEYDYCYSVAQTTDDGYIVAGHTNSFGAGGYDVYLVKTDSLGYSAIGESPSARPEAIAISAYPNPFNSAVRITWERASALDNRDRKVSPTIEIFDINGRMVANIPVGTRHVVSLRNETVIWSPDESLGSGIYLVRIKGTNAATKIIYMK